MKLELSKLIFSGAKLASNATHAIFRNVKYSCQIGKRENKILNNVRLFLQNLLACYSSLSLHPIADPKSYSSASSS